MAHRQHLATHDGRNIIEDTLKASVSTDTSGLGGVSFGGGGGGGVGGLTSGNFGTSLGLGGGGFGGGVGGLGGSMY